MAGIVTQNRILHDGKYTIVESSGYGNPPPVKSRVSMHVACDQTTTSYRSKGSEEDDLSPEELRTSRNGFTTFNPEYDRGHEFFTTRTSVHLTHPDWDGWGTNRFGEPARFSGPLIAVPAPGRESSPFPNVRKLASDEIKSFGARSIVATSPTAPQASLTTAIGEFVNDGLPGLFGHALLSSKGRQLHKKAGEEYLNVEFAWKPLVSDIRSVVTSLANQSKTLRQLVRDSGKNVRRSFWFPPESSEESQDYANSRFGSSPYASVNESLLTARPGQEESINQIQCTLRQSRQVYFKGSYTYHIAVDETTVGELVRFEQLASKLLGTRFDASTAWNLTPWSWLIDWQATIGTALQSASMLSSDGLVLRYGYLMSTVVDEYICTVPFAVFKGGSMASAPTTIFRRESKERVRATPFGFGLDLSSLTGRQWSILAALGMSKGDRRLR